LERSCKFLVHVVPPFPPHTAEFLIGHQQQTEKDMVRVDHLDADPATV
jgi:hypothetical protein